MLHVSSHQGNANENLDEIPPPYSSEPLNKKLTKPGVDKGVK